MRTLQIVLTMILLLATQGVQAQVQGADYSEIENDLTNFIDTAERWIVLNQMIGLRCSVELMRDSENECGRMFQYVMGETKELDSWLTLCIVTLTWEGIEQQREVEEALYRFEDEFYGSELRQYRSTEEERDQRDQATLEGMNTGLVERARDVRCRLKFSRANLINAVYNEP